MESPNQTDDRAISSQQTDDRGAVGHELQALRRSEAVLRDFIETSTIALHWVGPDGTILWANQAELDLLGYTRDEYIGRNIAEIHADEPVINNMLACLSRGKQTRWDTPSRWAGTNAISTVVKRLPALQKLLVGFDAIYSCLFIFW